MNGKPESSIGTILKTARDELKHWVGETERLAAIQKQLAFYMPKELHAQLKVGPLKGGHLMLWLSQAAWAFRLRHETHTLTQRLQKTFPEITTIAVKVLPEHRPVVEPRIEPPARLSTHTKVHLKETAQLFPESRLAQILERLSESS